MKKQLSDYLHFYWGQRVLKFSRTAPATQLVICGMTERITDECVLVLRPLSDMTIDEWNDCAKFARTGGGINTAGDLWKINAQETAYLLSKGFDLFGLIPANLAIDKTKLQ